jgi:hypothetical protein
MWKNPCAIGFWAIVSIDPHESEEPAGYSIDSDAFAKCDRVEQGGQVKLYRYPRDGLVDRQRERRLSKQLDSQPNMIRDELSQRKKPHNCLKFRSNQISRPSHKLDKPDRSVTTRVSGNFSSS